MTSKNKTYVIKDNQEVEQSQTFSELTLDQQIELFAEIIIDHLLTQK